MSQSRRFPSIILATLIGCSLIGCSRDADDGQKKGPFAALERADFNKRAAELYLPLFWREDADGDGSVDAGEIETLTNLPRSDRSIWIDDSGRFTQAFRDAYKAMTQPPRAHSDAAEQKRRELVIDELAQGRPTLVLTDATQVSDGEKTFLRHMLTTAELIERLYARQRACRRTSRTTIRRAR
jgi:hypothetical protein